MTIKEIYLDMDGVLTMCHWDALETFGVEIDEWPLGWWTEKVIKHHRPNVVDFSWDRFDFSWWCQLTPSVLCMPLVNLAARLVGEENVYIASRPTNNPQSWSGKVAWVHNYLPSWIYDNVILIKRKHLLAHPGALLVDDSPSNVQEFSELGNGKSLLVRQPWNLGYLEHDHLLVALELMFDWQAFCRYATGCEGSVPQYGTDDFLRLGRAHLAWTAERKRVYGHQ